MEQNQENYVYKAKNAFLELFNNLEKRKIIIWSKIKYLQKSLREKII